MIENMVVNVSGFMDAIRNHVGTFELEDYVRSQALDYTEWQREHYDAMTAEEIFAKVQEYSNHHSFKGKKLWLFKKGDC